MSVFERVYNLMKSHFERIPLENLTTEFLAGILESNQDILDSFAKKTLKLEGEANSLSQHKNSTLLILSPVVRRFKYAQT